MVSSDGGDVIMQVPRELWLGIVGYLEVEDAFALRSALGRPYLPVDPPPFRKFQHEVWVSASGITVLHVGFVEGQLACWQRTVFMLRWLWTMILFRRFQPFLRPGYYRDGKRLYGGGWRYVVRVVWWWMRLVDTARCLSSVAFAMGLRIILALLWVVFVAGVKKLVYYNRIVHDGDAL
jgi:hypothetical protein